MYAIIEIGGTQCKVSKSSRIHVPKMETETGKSITLDKVLLIVDKENVTIGKPFVTGAKVQAKVLSHGKDKKILVFKKKRRKDYKVLKGHRQDYTELQIDQITVGKETHKQNNSSASPKTSPAVKLKTTAKKSTIEKKPTAIGTSSSKATAKKTTEKTAVKKTTVKKTTASSKKKES